MWEQVRANQIKSVLLIVCTLPALMAVGYVGGSVAAPLLATLTANAVNFVLIWFRWRPAGFIPLATYVPLGGWAGIGVAGFAWLLMIGLTYRQCDRMLLNLAGARLIMKADHPQFYNVAHEMAIAAQLPRVPSLYVMDDLAMNAFTVGRSPEQAAIAVTAGVLGRLDRDELQGVVAHEVAHIVNRDAQFLSLIGALVAASLTFTNTRNVRGIARRYRRMPPAARRREWLLRWSSTLLALFGPVYLIFMHLAVTRRREYLADAWAAVYTRYPEGLASAFEVMSSDPRTMRRGAIALTPSYILNPFRKEGGLLAPANLTGSHPRTQERVRILRGIAGAVSYTGYQQSWRRVSGGRRRLPASALAADIRVRIRAPHAEAAGGRHDVEAARRRMREAGDLLRKVNEFTFLNCACGLRVKLPPEYPRPAIPCPRCGRMLEAPAARLAALAAAGAAVAQETMPTQAHQQATRNSGDT